MRTHPCTSRKALYVTAGECIGIEGLPHDEVVALIEELHAAGVPIQAQVAGWRSPGVGQRYLDAYRNL